MTPKKDKHSAELSACVTWREGIARIEEQKRKKLEHQKRLDQERRDAEAARRESAGMNTPVRGIGNFADPS